MRNCSYQRSTFLYSRHFRNRGIKDLWLNLECGSCHQKGKCGNFTLLFCRGWRGFPYKYSKYSTLLSPQTNQIYDVLIAVPVVDARAPLLFLVLFLFSSFCRGRNGLVHKYVPHVQPDHFSSFNHLKRPTVDHTGPGTILGVVR